MAVEETENYICEECDEEFDSESELREHNEEVHGDQQEFKRRRNVA